MKRAMKADEKSGIPYGRGGGEEEEKTEGRRCNTVVACWVSDDDDDDVAAGCLSSVPVVAFLPFADAPRWAPTSVLKQREQIQLK